MTGPGIPIPSARYFPAIFVIRTFTRGHENMTVEKTPVVTAILASPRATGRYVVDIDGKPTATLDLDAIDRLGIAVGMPVGHLTDELAREESALRTYDRALRMLTARARSARDLERQLVRKGEPADLVQLAVGRLAVAGLVDDERYAEQFVRSKQAGAGLAKYRLQQELSRSGVDRSVAAKAIADVFENEGFDEAATAEALARRRMRSLGNSDDTQRRRRLYQYLARRGYSPDIISSALARLSADREEIEE